MYIKFTFRVHVSPEYNVEDWIVDLIICEDSSTLVVVTAHNCVFYTSVSSSFNNFSASQFGNCNFVNESETFSVLNKKYCTENSLLYCGKIYGSSWLSCIIFSGTAFGPIHIWAPWTPVDGNCERCEPLYTITGMKGAVFSVVYNEENNLIGATSDDRSVRVWRILFESNNECNTRIESKNSDFQMKWRSITVVQVFSVFGHSARVWSSFILDDETVFSCGEDSTVCHWSKDGSLQKSWVAHPSSCVWCLCLKKDVLFTGGSDGAVKSWKINANVNGELKSFFPKNSLKEKEIAYVFDNFEAEKPVRAINVINYDTYSIITNAGSVWIFNKRSNLWRRVYQDTSLKNYVVSAVDCDSSLLALGTLGGFLIIINTETWNCDLKQAINANKIQVLIFLKKTCIISCSSFGKIQVLNLKKNSESGDRLFIEVLSEYFLPSCRHHWITAAAFYSAEKKLIVGDPSGNIYLYSSENVEPRSRLKSLHGKNGVTSIKTSGRYIITTGRDGCIRYLSVQCNDLAVICEYKVPMGKWLCGLFKIGLDAILPIFNGEKIQIWNFSSKNMITEVACGGGHRSWDILFNKKRFSGSGVVEEISGEFDIRVTSAFIKDGCPLFWDSVLPHSICVEIKSGHGREILGLEILFQSGSNKFFVFGGEDTILHTHFLSTKNMHKISEVKSHLSSIRSITKICDPREKLFSSNEVVFVTVGGRAQIKVWKAHLCENGFKLITSKDSKSVGGGIFTDFFDPLILCKEVSSHMLQPESERSWKSEFPAFDPETRYMDSLAFWISEGSAIFILASSDGFIRFFNYVGEDFNLFYQEDCQFCLLRLCVVHISQHMFIFATTTRGTILIWDYEVFQSYLTSAEAQQNCKTQKFPKSCKYQIQESGINSIACNSKNAEESYLVTGGDSGVVHLIKLTSYQNDGEDVKLRLNLHICMDITCHSSQVSGLAWLTHSIICSVSIDQRIIVWEIENEKLKPLSALFCSVPNVQGMKFVKSNSSKGLGHNELNEKNGSDEIIVYGAGIQIFRVCDIIK
ncbi:WD repeat-containing protein 6 [Armadillidium nasatum]|uniref:tRNA (34-2'-O)-methyltransferase regulator WDR6 n=1 Tax=Armadillidium nasatum TaxID=96803 RepID=A0A5N5SST3_9CRUS|nr:WD repeat-containing protein 6 [Armadillidium nasatum]